MTSADATRYEIRLAASAARKLETWPPNGLSLSAAAAVAEFLSGPLLDDPYRLGMPLRGKLAGLLSARRGAYRVVYSVDDDKGLVHVVRVDHRLDAYRA
ncbi:type II toxin-antitoxin system RelE/ParE family toxin [Microtetraspora fusca]|uniref:Type II toxin-antitoxin system RelE/ParE family toxin n=1 Tax=Microtetraspora fusca TaxID=1997 RepID=A0ABW6VHJ7_MICFU